MTQSEPATTEDMEPKRRVWRGPNALRALRHRDFALFWSGMVVSTTGSWMQGIAQGWLVFELTGSKLYLGLVGAAATLPMFVCALPSGVMADRFSKRKIVILTQTLMMIHAFVLAMLVYSGAIRPWQILILAALAGMINAMDVPARQAMTIELVGKEDLIYGVALTASAFNGSRIVGPAIAGVIVATRGAGLCFLINALSYLAVIAGLLMIRPTRARASYNGESVIAQIGEGLRYARHNVVIRDLLILTGLSSVFLMQYGTMMPVFAKDVLQVGAQGLGVMMAAAGAGALTAGIAVAVLSHRVRPQRIVAMGSLIAPIGLIAFSQSTIYPLSIACLAVTGFGTMLFLAVSNTLVQTAAPDSLRGRVLSVRVAVFMGLAWLGALQVGAIAQYAGVRNAMLFGGLACLAAALIFVLRSPALRPES